MKNSFKISREIKIGIKEICLTPHSRHFPEIIIDLIHSNLAVFLLLLLPSVKFHHLLLNHFNNFYSSKLNSTRNRKKNNNKSLISNSNHISVITIITEVNFSHEWLFCSFVGIYYIYYSLFDSILLFVFQHFIFMKRKIVNMELKRGEKKRVCLLLNNSAAEINVFDLDMVFREEIKTSHLAP